MSSRPRRAGAGAQGSCFLILPEHVLVGKLEQLQNAFEFLPLPAVQPFQIALPGGIAACDDRQEDCVELLCWLIITCL